MPDKKERDHWWAFLAGRPEAEWSHPKTPKRPRRNAQDRQRSGRMRAFSDDDGVQDAPPPIDYGAPQMPQETWHINDEGEVELALRIDPTESLPTPSGSPTPCSRADADAVADGQQMALDREPEFVPREPTPALLKLMDSASSLLYDDALRVLTTVLCSECAFTF